MLGHILERNGFAGLSHRMIVIVSLAMAASAGPAAVGQTAERAWRQMRDAAQFHLQDVAVTRDGRVVIVTEPPSHISAKQIASVLGAESHQVLRAKIGHDGWVADVVLQLGDTQPSQLEERLTELAILLHDTAYGFEYVKLPLARKTATRASGLDVRVGADDLRRWLIEERMTLIPAFGGQPTTATALLGARSTGVYASDPRGLVVWAIPIGTDLTEHRRECRRWAIDADLVVGGLKGSASVLVVGRARQLDVGAFAPLRIEEIMRLAAVDEDELAQSYERTHLLAGRWDGDRYHDWAPIYLSAALLDSEYGSILNITDQLLKSWSENGIVEYVNFGYPKPATWPFSQPLMKLTGGSRLMYNWNTTGVGHVIESSDRITVFAVHRTGALPVNYIAEGRLEDEQVAGSQAANDVIEHEETAYDYFAASGDVHLARVVQYVALYQLFTAFGVDSGMKLRGEIPDAGIAVFRRKISQALSRLLTMEFDEMHRLTEEAGKRAVRMFAADEPPEKRTELAEGYEVAIYFAAAGLQEGLEAITDEYGQDVLKQLAAMLAQPRFDDALIKRIVRLSTSLGNAADEDAVERVIAALPGEDQALLVNWILVQALMSPDGKLERDFLVFLIGVEGAKDDYARAFQAARTPRWIRTPSIVLSRDSENISAVGGHNLGTRVVKLIRDPRVPKGSGPRVTEKGGQIIVRVHPDDAAGTGIAARRLARSADPVDDAARIFRDAADDVARLPRAMPPRLQVARVPSIGPPTRPGRVRLGASPVEPPRNFSFPRDANLAIDDAGRMTFDGKSFFSARTSAARADEIVGWIRAKPLRAGDKLVLAAERGAMSEGELAGLTAQLRARVPRGITIQINRGRGSSLVRTDIRRATLLGVTEQPAGIHGRVYVAELATAGQKFSLRGFARRAVDNFKAKLRRAMDDIRGSNRPVTPLELKIRLEKVPGLDDVRFELDLPGETALDRIIYTDARRQQPGWTAAARAA